MVTLKNFSVEKDGLLLIENVNGDFLGGDTYLINCSRAAEKAALLGGMLGFGDYKTRGQILYKRKWALENKQINERMPRYFFCFTKHIPLLFPIKVRSYLQFLSKSEKRLTRVLKLLMVDAPFLEFDMSRDLNCEETQKLQMIEFHIFSPKLVFFDAADTNLSFFRQYAIKKSNATKVIFNLKDKMPRFPFKINHRLLLKNKHLNFA